MRKDAVQNNKIAEILLRHKIPISNEDYENVIKLGELGSKQPSAFLIKITAYERTPGGKYYHVRLKQCGSWDFRTKEQAEHFAKGLSVGVSMAHSILKVKANYPIPYEFDDSTEVEQHD